MSDSEKMTAQTSATKANDTPVTDSGSVVPGTVDSANGADDKLDEAAKFLAEAANDYPAMTPDIEKQLVKKIDRWMIPILLFVATLGAVDKVQIGTASLYGFQKDTHMHGQQYSWISSILPLGQVVGYFTTSFLMHWVPPANLLCTASIMWSCLTLFYSAGKNWSTFMALRFLLGFLESAISPSLTMLVTNFYKKSEQPPRNAIIFAYFSSVFNGFFAWLIGNIPESAPLHRWQYLYLLTGSINVLYSVFIFFVLPNSPMTAKFLSKSEKYYATQRLASNRTGISNRVWRWDQAKEAVTDFKVWLIVIFNITINIPNGGLSSFGSIVISNLGFSSLKASLLTMPFGILATSSAWLFSWWAARWTNRRCIVAVIALILPIIGTVVVYTTSRTNLAAQMIGLYFMYFYWPPYVVGISLPQANTGGQTKRAVTFSFVQIGYAIGNLIGPQTFRSNQAPKYTGAVIAMLVSYCACIGLLLTYFFYVQWENKNLDKKYGTAEDVHEGTAEGFLDITDKNEKNFRYTS